MMSRSRLSVLCLTRYGSSGPSSRYRFYQFLPGLKKAGIDVRMAPLLDRTYVTDLYAGRTIRRWSLAKAVATRLWALRKAHQFDLLWIEKELLPWCPLDVDRLLSVLEIPYVVDYDDAVFHQYDRHPRRWVRALFGRKIDRVMAGASVVVAGNRYLAERAMSAGAREIEVLPSVIDLDRYLPRSDLRQGRIIIGWIGSPSTQRYLADLAPWLAEFQTDCRAEVVAIGPSREFELPGVRLRVLPWSESSEVENLRSVDVGIMPLTNDPWSMGKCGVKLIQYMGCALPVIASNVGANAEIVVHGQTGYLASTKEDWLSALRCVASDAPLRQRMGTAGRLRAADHYSLRVVLPKLVDVLEKAARAHPLMKKPMAPALKAVG